MNLNLLYALCIDKLVLNFDLGQHLDYQNIVNLPLHGNAYKLTHDVSLRLGNTRTVNYSNNWEVWIGGILIGTLATDSRLPQSKITHRFTFHNSILYTEPGWYHYLGILTAATGLNLRSIGQLDIALDIQSEHPGTDASKLLYELDSIYRYLPRKYNDDVRYKSALGRLRIQEESGTYYFGHAVTSAKSSGKQIAVYCKSDEIKRSEKEYITDFHQANGLDTQRAIVRIEARLGSKYLSSKFVSDISDLLTPELLEALFTDAVGKAFQFRDMSRPERDPKHRNLKHGIVELVEFGFLNQQPIIRRVSLTHEESSTLSNCTTVKRLTTELIRHGAAQTRAELRRFTEVNPAPKNQSWHKKIEQYARQYPGKTGPKQMARVDVRWSDYAGQFRALS